MANNYRVPPASAYDDGPTASEKRFKDLKRVQEGLPPIHARAVTEAGGEPVADVPVTPKDLQQLSVDDPEAYRELRREFANNIFAGHDSRRGRGQSPFNRGVGA